jgi:pimeloyl-ACP methyl ester carboxylesterase
MRGSPTLKFVEVHGVRLAVWDWDGPGETLVFVHANGFHGRCWDQVVALLPEYRCLAVELRGHGRSDKPALPADWRPFGEDLAALVRALGLRGAVGVGHSIGGHAVALAAALVSEAFARLVLIDPVIMPRDRYQGARTGEHFVAQRRDRWPSPDAMVARFADRPPFNSWDARVLRDYCEYGLLPAPDGDGFVLACPPAFEAGVYQVSTAVASNIYPEIARVAQPTLVVRAGAVERTPGAGFAASPTVPDLATHFANGRDLLDPAHSHFLPMESPGAAVGYVRRGPGRRYPGREIPRISIRARGDCGRHPVRLRGLGSAVTRRVVSTDVLGGNR